MPQTLVYGIRHHGPGSARAVHNALVRDQPDLLAIEMPTDFQAMLNRVGDPGLEPPVALVAYNPKDVREALYYPLASFSPEWVAMRWASENGVPIVAIDLPGPLMLAKPGSAQLESSTQKESRLQFDPLGELALLAGYTDRERWWERTFELSQNDASIFPAVTDLIQELRTAYPGATSHQCQLREMHMARMLKERQKSGAQRVSVVCGAWHAPVLAQAQLTKTAKGFASAKRGLKGPRLEHTWIPWTYERLRSGGGYGAGVESPVWYQLLFDDPATAPAAYLTLMARELRRQGHGASTAGLVDAVELLDSLLTMRGRELPGIDELLEVAKGALAEGSVARLTAVRRSVESLRRAAELRSFAPSA